MVKKISGFPEWLPEQRRIEQQWIDIIRDVFESHGYVGIESASVEEVETIKAKGDDADKEIYTLSRLNADPNEDTKARLALHFDLTVPMARYVAQNYNDLTFPFKRYQIQSAWRGERPQEGRYREFTQADIDVLDNESVSLHFDVEMPRILFKIFDRIGLADIEINVNNRKIIEGFYTGLGISDPVKAIQIIDKLDKIGPDKIHELLMIELNASKEQASKCLSLASIRMSSADFAQKIAELGVSHPLLQEGIDELENIMRTLSDLPKGKVYANLAIARGLNYYTGTVYEGKLTKFPDFPTIFAGGRYKNLVGTYLNKELPGVGISIGITRIFGKLLKEGLLDVGTQTPTEVLLIQTPDSDVFKLEQAAEKLRNRGINTEVYPDQIKIGKQIKYAERKDINYLIFLSEAGGFEMKDLKAGEQIVIDFDTWLPPIRKYKLVPSNHQPFVKK